MFKSRIVLFVLTGACVLGIAGLIGQIVNPYPERRPLPSGAPPAPSLLEDYRPDSISAVKLELITPVTVEKIDYNYFGQITSSGKFYTVMVEPIENGYAITVTHPDFTEPFAFNDYNTMELSYTLHIGEVYIQRQGYDYWLRFYFWWQMEGE